MRRAAVLLIFGIACAVAAPRLHAQMTLSAAVDLALRNSTSVRIAQADRDKSQSALDEARDAYIPSLTFTSGLAYTNGFPIGDPSVVRFAAQSLLFNFSQHDTIRAAKSALGASMLNVEDQREQVILDTALTFTELAAEEQTLVALDAEKQQAEALIRTMTERGEAGLESQLAIKRAQLREAQTRLKHLSAVTRAADLRQHLSDLTGMPVTGLRVDGASVPGFPPLPDDTTATDAQVNSSFAVKEADAQADAKKFEAFAQHRILYRPEIDFVAQYGYFANFNNYSVYYNQFSNSNAAIGVQFLFPIENAVQRAHARGADADAAKASIQAQAVRNAVRAGSSSLALQVNMTASAEDVARLQQEIAAAEADALNAQATAGSGTEAPPVTPQQVSEARIGERQLYADYLAARYEHVKAELNWLKSSGELETWARSGSR